MSRVHDHVITLQHLDNDIQQFECECGENAIGPEKLIKALILAHRMENFWRVRKYYAKDIISANSPSMDRTRRSPRRDWLA